MGGGWIGLDLRLRRACIGGGVVDFVIVVAILGVARAQAVQVATVLVIVNVVLKVALIRKTSRPVKDNPTLMPP